MTTDPNAGNGTGLLEQRTQPPTALGDGRYTFCNPATAGCVVYSRVLARGVVLPSSNAFAYYDFGGALTTCPPVGETRSTASPR